MQSLQHSGATIAPSASPEALQRRHVSNRIGVSPALASAMAGLAFGPARRSDLADLAALTVARTASCVGGHAHG